MGDAWTVEESFITKIIIASGARLAIWFLPGFLLARPRLLFHFNPRPRNGPSRLIIALITIFPCSVFHYCAVLSSFYLQQLERRESVQRIRRERIKC